MKTQAKDDRRRAVRHPLSPAAAPRSDLAAGVRAIVRGRDFISQYAVYDLAVGGARLVGPELREHVLVEVTLVSPHGAPVRVLGRVAHACESEAGVAFLHQQAETEDAIQAMLLRALERRAARPEPASEHVTT